MSDLVLAHISKSFGGVQVLQNVSLTAEAGKLTALIGPNGAGKSTLANIISGLVPADSGRVLLDDHDLTRLPAYKRARMGLSRTFQNLELFSGLTVRENAVLGAFRELRGNPWYSPLRARGSARDLGSIADEALVNLGIAHLASRPVDELGFGDAKLVEPARLLAAQPVALVMDEPAAGLAWKGAQALGRWMRDLAVAGVAVVLIEHNMRLVMEIADHIAVLDHGTLIAEGSPAEIRRNETVLEAYLGHEVAP